MVLALSGVTEGRSYGVPSFLPAGRFFMQLDPRAFFFTEHCRNCPAVLIRLAEVPRPLLKEVLGEPWRALVAKRGTRTAGQTGKRRTRRKRADRC
jgi:hypothetical protein